MDARRIELGGGTVTYREATPADVPAMVRCRLGDPTIGPADPRMARYLEGEHHPQLALAPRVMFVGLDAENAVGYIGGHLTKRFDCDGELQYLYVVPRQRRNGVASGLLALLVEWFSAHRASRVCVDVEPGNAAARAFYARHGASDLNPHWMVWTDIGAARGDR